MSTFKNIRIAKRGGGTRLQRVKVLKSGKYKFVKNPKKSKSRPKAKTKTKTKRRKNPMARKKKGRKSRQFTIPLAVVAGVGAGVALPIKTAMEGNYPKALGQLVHNYTGIEGAETGNPRFVPHHLLNGLLPLAVGVLIHKFVGGPPLNVNRSLAAAGVPFIRI